MSTIRDRMREAKCGLHGFERNNYYYGKLLSVRDMRAEQAYHIGRLNTLTGFVAGVGVVCGLDVETELTTEVVDGTDVEMVVVTVSPGLAHDSCGRQVVLDETVEKTYELGELSGEMHISVYLTHRPCTTESVPLDGLENACEEECADNRILEKGEVDFVLAAADDDERYKAVPLVDFPSKRNVGERPRLLADAPPQTFFVEHRPAGDEEVRPLAVVVLGSGNERRLYNAATSPVDLNADDILVAGDGRRYVVAAADARTLEARTDPLEREALTLAFGEDPLEVLKAVSQSISGATTAPPETEFRVSVDDTGTTETAQVENDNTFAIDFDFSGFDVGDTFRVFGELSADVEGGTESVTFEARGVVVEESEAEEEEVGDESRALASVARSYYENQPLAECTTREEEAVFVGSVVRETDDEKWERARFERGPQVYGNDLLYAGVTRHATDFRNPHETALELKRPVDGGEQPEVDATANLDSGSTYVRGQTLLLSNVPDDPHHVHTVGDDEPGPESVVTEFSTDDGTAEIETDSFEVGDYVVTNSDFLPVRFTGGRAEPEQTDVSVEDAAFTLEERADPTGTGAVLTTADLPTADYDVQFASPEQTVSIRPDVNTRTVEFDIAGLQDIRDRLDELATVADDLERLENRIREHETYLRRKTLECKLTAFSVVRDEFDDDRVDELVDAIGEKASEAIDEGLFKDGRQADYRGRLGELFEDEAELRDHLEDGERATTESLKRYARALDELEAVKDGEDALQIAHAQDCVSEAAEWLAERPQIG